MTDIRSADLMTSGTFGWPCKINKNCLSVCLSARSTKLGRPHVLCYKSSVWPS